MTVNAAQVSHLSASSPAHTVLAHQLSKEFA